MKSSIYNHIIKDEEDDIILLYNSLKNSLIEDEEGKVHKVLDRPGEHVETSRLSDEEVNTLIEYGFIVNDTCNETNLALEYLTYKFNEEKNLLKSRLNLVITPTMGCNFKCFYCYETSDAKKELSEISSEVQDNILKYIEKSILSGVKLVEITWYGGEPLMRKDIIYDLQNKINIICKNYNVKIQGNVVTNGVLLDKETSDRLYELGISMAQITIDGTESIHNKRRYFSSNPNQNYRTIINNILSSNPSLKIVIRINIDKQNKSFITKLIDDLILLKVWPHREHLKIYFAFVDSGLGYLENPLGLSKEECYDLENSMRLYMLKKYNDTTSSNIAKLEFKYPIKGGKRMCGYHISKNSWIVDCEGKLYRCWEAVGHDEFVYGNIRDLANDTTDSFECGNFKVLPFKEWGCMKCKFLPICGLGCPWSFIPNFDVRKCTDWKYSLNHRILQQYKLYKENPTIFKKLPFANE